MLSSSIHVIAIVVLVIALIGALGLLFWQNFINKPVEKTAENATSVAKESVSPSPSPSPALKSYCTPIEKICFDYPDSWSVAPESTAGVAGMTEKLVVRDQAGKDQLNFQVSTGQLGGACLNEDNSYIKIIKTHTTGVTGTYAFEDTNYNGTSKNWGTNAGVSSSQVVSTIGKIDPCASLTMSMFNSKNVEAGHIMFTFSYSDDPTTYPSEAEATAALNTQEATQAYAVLQSTHY